MWFDKPRTWLEKHTLCKVPVLCAGTLLFLGAAYVVYYRHSDLWHLWLPTSIYNDEVMYNRQVAGILAGGQPSGYFGYNETHAEVGRFGAWGPILIGLYALPGLVTGDGVNAMFWCNILFAVAGWAVFAWGTRLPWYKQLAFGVALFCVSLPLQMVFSGLAEPSQYFLILVIVGAAVALQRDSRRGWFVLLALACTLITLVRAYTALLWIFPIVVLWNRKRSWSVVSIVLAFVSLLGYFAVTAWCNAPFFTGGDVDYTVFECLANGRVLEGVSYEVGRIFQQIGTLWENYVAPTLAGELKPQGLAFLVMELLFLITLISLCLDLWHKRPVMIRACALVCVFLSQMAMLALYTMDPMTRHYTMLAVLLLAACVYEWRAGWLVWLPTLVFPLLAGDGMQLRPLPTYSAQIDAQIQQVHAALADAQSDCESKDPWAHTIAYAYGDNVFHGYLYAVPSGMGIEFDWNTYLADETQPIYSHYAMVNHGTEAEARLLADGWQELVSTEDLVVYEQNTENEA